MSQADCAAIPACFPTPAMTSNCARIRLCSHTGTA